MHGLKWAEIKDGLMPELSRATKRRPLELIVGAIFHAGAILCKLSKWPRNWRLILGALIFQKMFFWDRKYS